LKSLFFCPVYNQREEFPAVLAELARGNLACDVVLLVNNGSHDGSERLVRDSGLPFLEVERNRGLGHAFQLALDWAMERGFDVFGSIAANGKMRPAEMNRLLEPILAGSADWVNGSRFLRGGVFANPPPFRRLTIPAVTWMARKLTGRLLTDATCGYRAFRTGPLRRAEFDWRADWLRGYGFEFYVYAKFLLDEQLRCVEAPVSMRYPARGGRYSKIPPLTGWWSMLRPWWVARFDGRGFRRSDTHPA